ncbi:Kinesin light chain [Fusarium acuminatum]|uniref:Kinesin light chain n=1 Tax=Fusarium acuminatum TaxID=5515 RepID=A0ABZ2X6Y6_9HYPO
MVESLSRDNPQIVSYLQREFVDVLGPEGKSEVVCFYEDSMSLTAVQDDKGKWKMNGPLAVLVSKPSATQCRPWENGSEHICAISRPHSEMVKFAENDHEYDKVLYWVNASNAEQFRRSFLDIAQKCQIPDYDKPEADVLTLVKHWLEDEQRGHWLMAIDNADDMTMFFQPSESVTSSGITMTTQQGFASYLPNTAKGVILITTRNKKLGVKLTRGKGHCDVKVDRMQDDESQALLRRKLPEQDYPVEQLLALASRLEYLPLALVQAAAFMKAQSMSISSQGFEPDEPTTITPIAVTETLIITF